MKKYVIDGLFLTQRITGTQRYAYEVVSELDGIVQPGAVEILVPEGAKQLPDYKNIAVVRYGKRAGIPWQQLDFARYLRRTGAYGICLNNVLPIIYKKGIIALHDVGYKARPDFFHSLRDKLSACWHRFNYWCAAHSDMTIVTVSQFSRDQIVRYYTVDPARIHVIYPSWQHVRRIDSSADLYKKHPMLSPKGYYFSMSSLNLNKNFAWVLQEAKNNPGEVFAIAGGGRLERIREATGSMDLPNVFYLGYVSDSEAKTLMSDCKAFLFPSKYEGFGLPPLEVLACGGRAVVSDISVMHEVYGNSVYYVDPNNCHVDLDELVRGDTSDPDATLSKYSWKRGAEALLALMEAQRSA